MYLSEFPSYELEDLLQIQECVDLVLEREDHAEITLGLKGTYTLNLHLVLLG